MDISILICLYNEVESLPELTDWITHSMAKSDLKDKEYEVVMVDDGSTDGSWDIIKKLSSTNKNIRGISFRRNYGKSAALFTGFQAVEGDVIITMDADLQDSPDEIPSLYHKLVDENLDLISGWKKKRYDNRFTKNLPSIIYNHTARRVTGLKLHDMNCGIKAYRKEVVKDIELYGDMHRYIPYIALNAGYSKIDEKVVEHRKRKFGKSKFGISRFFNGFLDLLTLNFFIKWGKKPMHIFGVWGILSFIAGFIITAWIIINKVSCQVNGLKYRPVTEQPLFYIALCFLLMGILLFLTGFLGELISRSSQERNNYNIKEKI
ncbi:MAG: glycosyltransferase family 2 protein [Bacteroidales bacterium]